ncbi:MAG: ATP-binding cassette domain-containing protein [Candidatus Rokubacteria bacterium]|nr:ATP-binding cassette domain-containing protein [Candidatus Rokubacteria bacterium]
MAGAILEAHGVSKRFGGLSVLRGVGFRVADAEIVGLIGPNGAGKTTLFHLISGLHRPSVGSIRFWGSELVGRPPHSICRLGIARTFQNPRPFLELTARQNVEIASRFAGRPPLAAPDELLGLVGLADEAGVPARRLAAARRKLLELGMVLALGPRLLLLDEPLAGLTPTEIDRATALLRQIRERWGVALFWVEHVMRAVMGIADRAIVLHHGEVIAEGPPRAVAGDPRVLEAYLGHKGGNDHEA